VVGSVLIASLQNRVFAQITPDNTLPKNSSVARDRNTFNITGGTQAGSNLFHSFREFSVPTNGTASFNNAGNIQNIITRVTGGSISNIDGLIRANGTANLFLLNPNGIIFGANARLDIGGSFLATTASSFKWSDGSTFSATNPQPPSELLAINPSALFFNQLQAARIENRSTSDAGNNLKGLRVPDGRSLLLVGGDIVLNGGSLNALGGLVELAGVSGKGTVGLNIDSQDLSLSIPNDVPRADISLSNGAVVDVRAGGGGSITVNARNLDLKQQSYLVAGIKSGLGTVTATAGDIKINASDTVSLDNSLVNSRVEENGQGNAGSVSIITGSLAVTNGAALSASTHGKGNAGSVNITARDAVKFDGEGSNSELDSGAFSEVKSGAEGNAGGVSIITGSLAVTNGAVLSASTVGKGDANSVIITARDTIKFDGEGKDGFDSGAYSRVYPRAEGNAKDVLISTGSLEVTNGAILSASTFGKGNAGSVNITADTIKFDGEGSKDRFNSGAYSRVIFGAEGNAKGVLINTGSLEVTNGARLSADTFGKGNAGSVNIFARDAVKFDGEGSNSELDSGAFSEVKSGAEGNAGGVSIITGSLAVTNGAVLSASTVGKGDANSVIITARDTIKFDGEGKDGFDSGAYSRVYPRAEGNAKDVLISTGSLEVTNGAILSASTFGKGNAGSVNITADTIKFDGEGSKDRFNSGAYSRVIFGAEGNAKGVSIHTGSLEVTNGALLSADTFGKGDAGSVNITADTIKFDGEGSNYKFDSGAFSEVKPGAEGNAGGVSIITGSLAVTNGAVLSASTVGKGDANSVTITARDTIKFDGEGQDGFHSGAYSRVYAGAEGNAKDVLISTGSLAVTNGALLSASTFGKGNAGSVSISARDTIKFDGKGQDGVDSGAYSRVIFGAEGNAGGVSINTGSLEVTNGAVLSASTFGKGNAGSVSITARDTIKFDGEDNKDGSDSGAYSRVYPGAEGNARGVSIHTGSLEVTNGAQVSASTLGKGNADSVTITARDTIKFDGEDKNGSDSGAYSEVNPGAEGNAKDVSINTGLLEVTNGAQVSASTLGKGNAGRVSINARDTIKFDGEGKDGFDSGAYSRVYPGAEGNAKGVSITTGSLAVTNGAQLSASTLGKGDAGSVTIFANTFEASNGGQVSTITSGESHAGNITFQVKDNISLSGLKTGLFANTSEGSIGNGGNIIIDPRIMTIRDGAVIAVDSQGEGIGGNIQLAADFLTLDRGTISAATRSNTGGNITLNLQELLLLRDRSQITSTAGVEQFGGDGGNITINAPNGFILAVPSENSDITANAFTGSGGRVDIQANGIYGIEFRKSPTVLSDITASSEFGTQGTVELNTLDIDPNNGLVQLPTIPVDTQVAQGCYSPDYAQNRFVITGRSGLPMSPTEPLQDSSTLSAWVRLRPKPANAKTTISPQPTTVSNSTKVATATPIVEATGWVVDRNGNIELVAQAPSVTPHSSWQTPASCPASR
jgi:filamentous hemagglutinin family protein